MWVEKEQFLLNFPRIGEIKKGKTNYQKFGPFSALSEQYWRKLGRIFFRPFPLFIRSRWVMRPNNRPIGNTDSLIISFTAAINFYFVTFLWALATVGPEFLKKYYKDIDVLPIFWTDQKYYTQNNVCWNQISVGTRKRNVASHHICGRNRRS